MLASQLIALLQARIDKHGDLPVTMLDDETGDYEGVHCVFFTDIQSNNRAIKEFELCTYGQADRDTI